MVRCRDGTYYTGATNDLVARVRAHNTGRGARYTRGRGPVRLVYTRRCRSLSEALRREAGIKRLSRAAKHSLVRLES